MTGAGIDPDDSSDDTDDTDDTDETPALPPAPDALEDDDQDVVETYLGEEKARIEQRDGYPDPGDGSEVRSTSMEFEAYRKGRCFRTSGSETEWVASSWWINLPLESDDGT